MKGIESVLAVRSAKSCQSALFSSHFGGGKLGMVIFGVGEGYGKVVTVVKIMMSSPTDEWCGRSGA